MVTIAEGTERSIRAPHASRSGEPAAPDTADTTAENPQ
jgi:hypothetical protein